MIIQWTCTAPCFTKRIAFPSNQLSSRRYRTGHCFLVYIKVNILYTIYIVIYIYMYIQITIDVYTHFLLHIVKFSSNRHASCEWGGGRSRHGRASPFPSQSLFFESWTPAYTAKAGCLSKVEGGWAMDITTEHELGIFFTWDFLDKMVCRPWMCLWSSAVTQSYQCWYG